MDGPRCVKGSTLRIHEKPPVSSCFLVLGQRKLQDVCCILYRLSAFIAWTNIINDHPREIGSGMYICI